MSVIPTQIANKTLVNDTDVPATRTLAFQETVTNESSFSELTGLKITDKVSATYKVAIAKFLDAEYTGETTSEYTWNYTERLVLIPTILIWLLLLLLLLIITSLLPLLFFAINSEFD